MQFNKSIAQLSKFLLLLILFTSGIYSQINDAWLGVWKGELLVYQQAGTDKLLSVHMELHISKADSAGIYNWRIIYNDSSKDDRKYLLRTLDYSNGKYTIDEKDGILLEMNLFDNVMISRVEVDGELLDITHKLEGDKIVFEIIAGSSKPTSTTSSSLQNATVNSYTAGSYQRAYLYQGQ